MDCVPAAKLERANEFAARALAAYNGYASTRKVKTPEKTSSMLNTKISDGFLLVGILEGEADPAAKTELPMIGTNFISFAGE